MKRTPLYFLDLLKLMVLFAIQTFHSWEFIFFEDKNIMTANYLHQIGVVISRPFSLGGQILVAIVYFLFGLTAKSPRRLLRLSLFALLGQIALTFAFFDKSFFSSLEWDIYSFIILTNVLLALIPFKKRSHLLWIILSLIILLIPPHFWQQLFPEGLFFDILSGRKTNHHSASWAPLPWFFLALLFFSLGDRLRKNEALLKSWNRREAYTWGILLLGCAPFMEFYFMTPLGPHFYEFNFTQNPWIFWPAFLPFVFWMRVSFLDVVQEKAKRMPLLLWISELQWCRNVGLTYLIAILYLGIGAEYSQQIQDTPYAFDLFYVLLMPICEVVSRIIQRSVTSLPLKLKSVL